MERSNPLWVDDIGKAEAMAYAHDPFKVLEANARIAGLSGRATDLSVAGNEAARRAGEAYDEAQSQYTSAILDRALKVGIGFLKNPNGHSGLQQLWRQSRESNNNKYLLERTIELFGADSSRAEMTEDNGYRKTVMPTSMIGYILEVREEPQFDIIVTYLRLQSTDR